MVCVDLRGQHNVILQVGDMAFQVDELGITNGINWYAKIGLHLVHTRAICPLAYPTNYSGG